jgi:hypothetical protein
MFNSSINKFPLKIIRKKKTALTPGRAALARAIKWEGGNTEAVMV